MESNKIEQKKSKLFEFGKEVFYEAVMGIPIVGEMMNAGKIDLAIFTGSFVKGNSFVNSDIDLFLVVPLKVQTEFSLKPEYTFNFTFDGNVHPVEISFVTTEKLLSDQYSKSFMFWWDNSIEVYSRDRKFSDALQNASEMKDEDLKDKLWTANFLFKLGMYDIEKNSKRFSEGNITSNIVYYDCLKNFVDFYLLTKRVVTRFSSFEQELVKLEPDFFLNSEHLADTFHNKKVVLGKCNEIIDSLLLQFGFSQEEVENWSQCNLTRLTFQKY